MPGVSVKCCGKVIPSLRLVGSLNRTSAMLFKSWRNICAESQLRHQYVGYNRIEGAEGLLDSVLEELLGRRKLSGWVQLVMGHQAWREIAFGMLSLYLWPEGCSCANDCRVQD